MSIGICTEAHSLLVFNKNTAYSKYDKIHMKIESYKELESFLENWTSALEDGLYDYIGALHLLCSILRNLGKNMLDHEWESLADIVTDEEIKAIKSIVNVIK